MDILREIKVKKWDLAPDDCRRWRLSLCGKYRAVPSMISSNIFIPLQTLVVTLSGDIIEGVVLFFIKLIGLLSKLYWKQRSDICINWLLQCPHVCSVGRIYAELQHESEAEKYFWNRVRLYRPTDMAYKTHREVGMCKFRDKDGWSCKNGLPYGSWWRNGVGLPFAWRRGNNREEIYSTTTRCEKHITSQRRS